MAVSAGESGEEMAVSADNSFTVLLEFQESNKQVKIPNSYEAPDNFLDILETHLKRIDDKIRLVIDYSDCSESQRDVTYILQRHAKKWGRFVDVEHVSEISNGDHLRAVLLPRSALSVAGKKDPNQKAATLLAGVKKPTDKQAVTLNKLFPCSSGKFNPRAECVAKAAHSKKKKFTPKLASVTVILMKNYQTRIPRGECRQDLFDKERVKKVELHRQMSPEEVKRVILDSFAGCKGFTVLDCAKGGYLLKTSEELTAKTAIDRRGALYLCEANVEKKISSSSSVSAMNDAPSSSASVKRDTTVASSGGGTKRTLSDSGSDFDDLVGIQDRKLKRKNKKPNTTAEADSDSDLEIKSTLQRADDTLKRLKEARMEEDFYVEPKSDNVVDLKEPVLLSDSDESVGLPATSVTKSESLEEYRRIRREQDEAYELSLKADQMKEQKKEMKRKMEELRVQLKSKFDPRVNVNDDSVLHLSVILPNSDRIKCTLPHSCTSKALYEAVFAMSALDCPFQLYTRVGHVAVNPSAPLSECLKVSSVFVVEDDQDSDDVLQFLATLDDGSIGPTHSSSTLQHGDEAHCVLESGVRETEDLVSCEDQEYGLLRKQEYLKRKSYMEKMSCEQGLPHLIRREHIYGDVLRLYAKFSAIVHEFPFRVAFDNENAVDTGGVSRDMLSGFWSCAFKKFFDGSGSLVPATHPTVDMSVFPSLGLILSHGYVACGFLPVHISFPVIAVALLGPTVAISDDVLCESFVSHLSCHDASILRGAFSCQGTNFSSSLQSSLMVLLGSYGCRQIPSSENIRSLVTMIAKHEFLIKPLAPVYAMFGGVPAQHKDFWKDVTAHHLMQIYLASSATAHNVLRVIKEPEVLEPLQETAYSYLLQYVGNMSNREVRHFLRYVTGSSALVVDEISITFNGLTGIARRPIAHTCSCTLEIPVSYSTYLEFSQEFDAILNDELSWIMDGI